MGLLPWLMREIQLTAWLLAHLASAPLVEPQLTTKK